MSLSVCVFVIGVLAACYRIDSRFNLRINRPLFLKYQSSHIPSLVCVQYYTIHIPGSYHVTFIPNFLGQLPPNNNVSSLYSLREVMNVIIKCHSLR